MEFPLLVKIIKAAKRETSTSNPNMEPQSDCPMCISGIEGAPQSKSAKEITAS